MALCVGASAWPACEGWRREEGRAPRWARALGSPRLLLDLTQKSPLSAAARGGKQTARIVENAESSSWRNSTAWQRSEPGSARQQLPQRAGRPWHPEPVPGPGGRDTDTPVCRQGLQSPYPECRVFSLSQGLVGKVGKGWAERGECFTRKEKNTLLSCPFRFAKSSHSHNTVSNTISIL